MTDKLKHKYGGPHRVEVGMNRSAFMPMDVQDSVSRKDKPMEPSWFEWNEHTIKAYYAGKCALLDEVDPDSNLDAIRETIVRDCSKDLNLYRLNKEKP